MTDHETFVVIFGVTLMILLYALIIWFTYQLKRRTNELMFELRQLREGVDNLRLNSRARVGSVRTEDGPQLTRTSRSARGRRLVVGGNPSSEQFQELSETASDSR